MEPIYKPDETKRIIEELRDPLLIVEFNPVSMEWEVSRVEHGTREFSIPGFFVGSQKEIVDLNYVFEYYSVVGTYKHWGQHVFDDMRFRRPERQETKEIINEIDVFNDKAEKSIEIRQEDVRNQTKKEIGKRLSPTIYSYSKVS